MTLTARPGRRELNKAQTRQRMIDAVLALVAERPTGELTVEDVARHAGVSRRTFFNYFGSIESVIVDATHQPIDDLGELLATRPAHEPVLDSVIAVLRQHPLDESLLCWVVAKPAGTELHARVSQSHQERLEQHLAARMGPSAGRLEVATLAATVLAVFAAVQQVWVEEVGLGTELTTASVARFNDLLVDGLGQAARGWAT